MTEFFYFSGNIHSKAIIEICPTESHDFAFVEPYLYPTSKTRLPNEVVFRVVRGRRWTDVIVYHEAWSHTFYSQKIIDILGKFLDMSDKCYPIHIEGTDQRYYVIYNIEEYTYLNQKYGSFFRKPPYFELPDACPPLFTLSNSNLRVCSKELKEALIKAKIVNIRFRDVCGLTKEEKAIYEATEAIEDKKAYEKWLKEWEAKNT